MPGPPVSPPTSERLVPSALTTDTGPGLVESPLRISNWIGFLGSWLLVAAGITWLFVSGMQIMGVGGFCAEGGPYEIATHCPANSALFMNFGFVASAAGVLLGIFGARGFGVPAHGFIWSLLFGVMGAAFLIAAFLPPDGVSIAWLICGLLFELVALPPVFLIRLGWPRSLFGRRRLDGRSLAKHGLPVRDAYIIAASWAAVSGLSLILALWLFALML